MLAQRFDNHGKIFVEFNSTIKANLFDNEAGEFFCNNQANLTVEEFRNARGKFSGVSGTWLNIKNNFISDSVGEIGANEKTILAFPKDFTIENLGIIYGKQVKILNAPIVRNDSRIISDKIIINAENNLNQTINMPQVIMQTSLLKLYGTDFNLGEQRSCERIILKLKSKLSLQFTYPLSTSGILEIHELEIDEKNIDQKMLDRFGEITSYDISKMPDAEYTLAIKAIFQADRGILVLAPSAKISLGEEAHNNHSELLMEFGNFNLYATEFDVENGGIAAKEGIIWTPKGCRLGRLTTDPARKVYSTFYATIHSSVSHNLERDILPRSYSFLGKEIAIYDGKHLLTMPVAISNGSFINIKDHAKIVSNDLFVADEEKTEKAIMALTEDNEEISLNELKRKEKGKNKVKSLQILNEHEEDLKLYEHLDKEQLLIAQQKQSLAEQIINNLNLQSYLQANLKGVNINVNQMTEIIIQKIDTMLWIVKN